MANVAKLLMIQGGKCFYCGNKLALENATIDHVIPKALGGDNTEANTVACCHSTNQVFGNASPKEKLTAVINSGGRIECAPKSVEKAAPAVIPSPAPVAEQVQMAQPQPVQKAAPKPAPKPVLKPKPATPKQTQPKQKPAPEKKPSELRKPLQEAFQAAAAMNGGDKALLTAVSLALRKKVQGFAVKNYGEKTFAKLVAVLGYRINKDWCLPPK